MDKDVNKFDIDEAFDSLFGEDLQTTKTNSKNTDIEQGTQAPNSESKNSAKTIPIDTNIEHIFLSNVFKLEKGHSCIDDRLMKECDFLVEHDIPELNKKNVRFNCDEFSIFFAALCAIYYQFYISKLCGNKSCNGKMVKVKSKLVQCLKMLTQEYKELYNDENIDFFVSHFDSYKDSWHKKKTNALKKFALEQKSSDEDFPYMLFSYCSKFFDYEESPIVKKELYRISLFCAYHSNINLIYKNANDFFLDKLIENKQKNISSPDNLRLIVQKSTFTHGDYDDTRNFKSLFWNLDDIISVLNLDHSIEAQKVRYYNDISGEKENPRKHFVKQEKSIIELIKRCFGKSSWEYGSETESAEQVTAYLRTALSIPQSIIQRFPTIAFFIYWSISFVKYNEFKSLFLENTNKPEAYQFEDHNHPYIKSTEYKKFVKNDFIAIPKETEKSNQASLLQHLLFFALLDLVNVPKLERISFSSTKNKKLVEKFKDALTAPEMDWRNPKTQLELLNELLKNNDLPTVTKNVDFCLFDGKADEKGFSQTESAINLIYNIVSFTSINPENGIVQQVNHLDELRDKTFKYHTQRIDSWNTFWNDRIGKQKRPKFEKEYKEMQSIDTGFNINKVTQNHLTNLNDICVRDFKCKLFLETDVSCVRPPKMEEYAPFQHQYRCMLSTLYIKPARNMHEHYSPFSPTEKLLEVRNFNDLLGILYDVKNRIENESTLYSVADTHKKFSFLRKGAFSVDGEQDSLHKLLQEIFDHIINSESMYIQNISKKKEKDVIDPIPFDQMHCAAKARDCIFKSIHEKTSDIHEYKDRLKEIPSCFTILKDQQKSFMEYIFSEWEKQNYREIITSLDCLKQSYNSVYWEALSSETPTPEDKKLHWQTYYKIESWESFFEWKNVLKDLKTAKMALEKLDYLGNGIAQIVNFDTLDNFSKLGDYNLFEKEVQEIAKQLPTFILFKNIYSCRNEFGIYENYDFSSSNNDNESWHYKCYQNDINEIAKEKDVSEMKKYLEFIDYEVLKNECYYPQSPDYKINFLNFLTCIDSIVESNFTDSELIAFSRNLSKKARNKLAEVNKEVDVKSIKVFEKDSTYDIHLLEITKSLLQRSICYLTSLKEVRNKLNSEPLLDHGGNITFAKEEFLGDKNNKGLKEVLGSKKYENPLREDLQKFLNFIFGVAGHYQRDDDGFVSEYTRLELFGDRFFLYLVRVTFEMSQLKDKSKKAT